MPDVVGDLGLRRNGAFERDFVQRCRVQQHYESHLGRQRIGAREFRIRFEGFEGGLYNPSRTDFHPSTLPTASRGVEHQPGWGKLSSRLCVHMASNAAFRAASQHV
jgi:hypothetical protein